ncbi:Phosphatidylinositol 4-kinase pik1alpha (PI4-kinase)(PtdIns-4-kinase) [Coemansia erecta]|nr:Phosphatidylinositol 4-kinase pik1alpha (PI4-kinase)(PtdIns-4-kinase) [Coemansia erecta]
MTQLQSLPADSSGSVGLSNAKNDVISDANSNINRNTESAISAVEAVENDNSSNTTITTVANNTTTNSSLLLRLFTSQFFDSWLAVSYLFRYPNIVGVQHYLCNELRKFPLEEVEFFLPQLVHLLITRPNESAAVESLLFDMALQSSHVAMLFYWYLQAYLADLTPNPRTASFKHCQRIINQVQELLFTDIAPELIIDCPDPVQHAYLHAMQSVRSTIKPPSRLESLTTRFRRMLRLAPHVQENLQAAIVGIGSATASIGAPLLAPTMGWLAVAQGQSLKQPERIGEEADLPPQHKMLSGKARAARALPLSRSSLVSREKSRKMATGIGALQDSQRKDEQLTSFSGIDMPSQKKPAPVSLPTDRISISQPATPSRIEETVDSLEARRSIAVSPTHQADPHGLAHEFAESPLAASDTARENDGLELDIHELTLKPVSDSYVQSSAASSFAAPSRPPRSSKRNIVGSRSPTPAERTSTDSCHTVAVMEDLQRVHSTFAGNSDSEAPLSPKRDTESRRQYLTKAAREFQRNARAIDRRLSRPPPPHRSAANDRISDVSTTAAFSEGCPQDTAIASRNGKTTALPADSCGADTGASPTTSDGDSVIPSSSSNSSSSASCMPETIADMTEYMECERQRLERRTGYFGAEIKFVTTLMDISQRVCAVSKAGRQQFLKAELTLLNHALDRNTCIPLWCPESDGLHNSHHRIVRIPTEDTVVLNSAERAPYLLTLEVLEPEMSSGPPDRLRSFSSAGGDSLAPARGHSSGLGYSDDDVRQGVAKMSASLQSSAPDAAVASPNTPSQLDSTDSSASLSDADNGSTASTDPLQEEPGSDMLTSAIASAAPISAQEVDEQLMAEVFGDIDDLSSVPSMPMSPAADRRLSGGFGSVRSYSHRQQQQPLTNLASPLSEKRTSNDTAPSAQTVRAAQIVAPAPLAVSPIAGSSNMKAQLKRVPVSQEEIRARMHTASVLLAQLARQQKTLGIKINSLVVPQRVEKGGPDSDGGLSRGETPESMKRRGKLSNAAMQALTMEDIRDKLIREMMQLEELRLKQPGLESTPGSAVSSQEPGVESDIDIHEVEFKDDPSAKVLKEDWESKKARIRRTSPFGRHKNWNLLSVIVKEGADLRQEQLALQLIREMGRIWDHEGVGVFVKYYRIMVTGEGCGLMETITNTVSVHSIKKEFYSRNPGYKGPPYTLYNYFVTSYGTPDTERFRKAQDNFMCSLVPYSLITYILQIRDRHNGNILLDTGGRIIHIDFGFMLWNSPGSVGFEQAPFKFPMEYIDILGGRESAKFAQFRELLIKAFLALRKHADNICLLVEMMLKDSPLPCLGGGAATVSMLRDRFHLSLSEQQVEELIDTLLVSSCDNITTRMYDAFQYYSNGIL